MSGRDGPLPFTVVGGFLGAGKTTLVNHLLRNAGGRRIAVIVNDFGSVNIDASLIASRDGDTIALTNGCICCSLAGEFGMALPGLLEREPPLDHVVVEASGVSDPFSVGQYGTTPGFRLEGVLTLADVETVEQRAADSRIGHQVRRQLERADLLVLTKVDLVSADQADAAERWLRELVPSVRVVRAVEGVLPLPLVLGDLEGGAPRPAEHDHHDTPEQHPFATAVLAAHELIERAALTEALDALPPGLLRLKGFVVPADDPDHRLVVQVVGRRVRVRAGEPPEGEARRSVLVALGDTASVDATTTVLAPLGFTVRG